MKKVLFALLALLLSVPLLVNEASAAGSSLQLKVNGQSISFKYGSPFVENGTSLLPLRDLLVGLGVPDDASHIVWNSKDQSVTAVKGDKTVKLAVGSKNIYLNGTLHKKLEVPAKSVSGRVFLPARAVAEAFGFSVQFDTKTSTIVIQDATGSTGSQSSSSGTNGIASMKLALDAYAGGISLGSSAVNKLTANGQAFFGSSRSPLSLDKLAQSIAPTDIARDWSQYQSTIVSLSFVELDSVSKVQLSNGQAVTSAIGHTGGDYRELTETWVDSTYFQMFYLGSANVAKGDKVTVMGIPVGQSTVELTNVYGVTSEAPMYVIVAGNLLSSSDEYNIRKENSENSSGTITIPELDAELQARVDRLQLTLTSNGLKIYDPFLYGMEIKSVQIGEYSYSPVSKTTIPDDSYDGLLLSLDSFKDGNGNPLTNQSGSFFVQVVTNWGQITQLVDFQG